jgi:hypothetical protein
MAAEQKVQSRARPTAKDATQRGAGGTARDRGVEQGAEQGVETDPEATHATRHRIGQTGVGSPDRGGRSDAGLPESDPPRPGGDPLGEAADLEPPSGAKSGRR